jgi:hypothetical protein
MIPTAEIVSYLVEVRFFDANAFAAVVAGITAPLFYLTRRAALKRAYSLELTLFNDLANGDPASLLNRRHWDDAADSTMMATDEQQNEDWSSIFGLPATTTIEEVKQAHKTLIRQNHPDLVQEMSPAFKALAEAETKKINVAYNQALRSIKGLTLRGA